MRVSVRALAIAISILCCCGTRSSAQLWTYLSNDPQSDSLYERMLDNEASSVVTRFAVVYSDTVSYPVRIYSIESFEGAKNKIAIFEKPGSHALSIECQDEKLRIDDIAGLANVHFLRPDLLEVVYSPRGGSDQGYEYTLILGIDKGKFCIVMALLTVNEYDMPGNGHDVIGEYGLYEIRLDLTCPSLRDCQLGVNVREKLVREKTKIKSDRSEDFDSARQYVLKFDEKRKIFYNQVRRLNEVFTIYGPSGTKVRLLAGDYPEINLGKDEYFYVNNMWYEYERGESGKRSSMSFVIASRHY